MSVRSRYLLKGKLRPELYDAFYTFKSTGGVAIGSRVCLLVKNGFTFVQAITEFKEWMIRAPVDFHVRDEDIECEDMPVEREVVARGCMLRRRIRAPAPAVDWVSLSHEF